MSENIFIDLGQDTYSVVLSDEDGLFGIRKASDDTIPVPAGEAVNSLGDGIYSYNFDPDFGESYIVVWKVQDESGGDFRYIRKEEGPFDDRYAQVKAVPEFRGTFSQGTYASLLLRVTDLDGNPLSPSSVNVTIEKVSDGSEVLFEEGDPLGGGLYSYEWTIAGSQTPGAYDILWTYEIDGRSRTELYRVDILKGNSGSSIYNQRYFILRQALENLLNMMMHITIMKEPSSPSADNKTYYFSFPRWNQSGRVNVYRNDILITDGYEIDFLGGKLTFHTENFAEDRISVDYSFRFFSDEQLQLFLVNSMNSFNIFNPHTGFSVTEVPDLYVPALLYGAATEAIRTFMQAMIWPSTRVLFEDRDRADKVYSELEVLLKSYEGKWDKMTEEKRKFGFVGLNRAVINPLYPMPGGRARFFRYMFGSGT